MIAGKVRECLKILRWKAADLAEELGYPGKEVGTWLEALVKAYKAVLAPCQNANALLRPEAARMTLVAFAGRK
jgi:hypothetical protein